MERTVPRSRLNRIFLGSFLLVVGGLGVHAQAAPVATTTTTLAIVSSGNDVAPGATVTVGTEITLTATVDASSVAVSTGQVSFCDGSFTHCVGISLLGTAQITGNGTAVLRLHPGPGVHSYQASFAGTPNGATKYASSTSSSVSISVSAALATATTIASAGSPGNYSLTATVTGSGSSVAPSGKVSFLDTSNENAALGSANLVAGASTLGFVGSGNPLTGSDSWSVATADFNGDGIADAAIANYGDGTVSIVLGKGDGTFTQAPQSPEPAGQTPYSIAVGDFNGDGIPDLVLANVYGGYITVLLGKGDGTFVPAAGSPIPAGNPLTQPQAIAVGDFNGDGIPDIAVGISNGPSFAGTLVVLLGNGDGTFKAAPGTTVPLGGTPISIAMADFNGDGILDLALANFGSSNANILLGNGDGTFTQAPNSPIAVGSFPWSVVAGDFNGDGISDLAIVNSQYTSGGPGTVSILLGNGNGTFAAASGSPVTVGSDPVAASVGDFNADGKADLSIANNSDDSVTILLGGGDGTFSQAAASPLLLYKLAPPAPVTGIELSDFPQSIAVADFNGDGISDLIVANSGASDANVLLSQLTQTSAATATGVSPSGTGAHLAEASYSGDTIWAASTSGTIALTAQQATPTVSLNLSSTGITTLQNVTVTVMVSGGNSGAVPTGTLSLTSGKYIANAAPLSAGSAAITIPAGSLPVGSDNLEVKYSGDANYSAATAAAVISVSAGVPPGFTINATAVTVTPGATTANTSSLTLMPVGGFTGSVVLSASLTSSPANDLYPPTFSFGTTSPVTLSGTGSGTAILTISTTAPTQQTCSSRSEVPVLPQVTGGGGVLACLVLFVFRRRKNWCSLLAMLILALGISSGLVGCSSNAGNNGCGGAPISGTAPGTYSITITGTSGGTIATQVLPLTLM